MEAARLVSVKVVRRQETRQHYTSGLHRKISYEEPLTRKCGWLLEKGKRDYKGILESKMSGSTTVSVAEGESPRKKPSGRASLPGLRITAHCGGCDCRQLRGREGCWVLVGWGKWHPRAGVPVSIRGSPTWCWHPPPPPKPWAARARRKARGYLEKEAPSVPFNFPAAPPIGRH